jgi:uncharacterized protein
MIIRRDLAPRLLKAAASFPAVTLTGPRQSGKSTLCRHLFPDHKYANLERPDVREFALDDPKGFLADHAGGAIIDEIQHAPELASWLQSQIDEQPEPGQWILTGSQNFSLSESVSQSLAGRTAVLHLLPLSLNEIQRFGTAPDQLDPVMFFGGYPRIHDQQIDPTEWLASYVATYLERDVRTLARITDLNDFQRFLGLCAGRSGQVLNYSALASDCGISQPTAKAWLSILEASFLVYILPAWSGNIRKRLTRSPRMVFLDSGLLCWLLGLRAPNQLVTHPLRGQIFESWGIAEFIKRRQHAGESHGLYYYRDQSGLETDLIIEQAGQCQLVEFKAGQTVTRRALSTLTRVRESLPVDYVKKMTLIHGGDQTQNRQGIEIRGWQQISENL